MLDAFEIENYRSFGRPRKIAPLGKINLFVGPNNCGKSNVLRFLNECIHPLAKSISNPLGQPVDISNNCHAGMTPPSRGRIGVQCSPEQLANALGSDKWTSQTNTLYEKLTIDGLLWIDPQWPSEETIREAFSWLPRHQWESVWNAATRRSGGDPLKHWIPDVLKRLRSMCGIPQPVFAIPIQRVAKQQLAALDGQTPLNMLASLQNPEHTTFDSDRSRFDKIQNFVRDVTEDNTATLSVTHSKNAILVKFKGQSVYPLEELGTGIEQVVLHAIHVTYIQNSIITFEEPELHLHPVLQRKLIGYLPSTTNQYFIATHSAHLIDSAHSKIFHVRMVDGQSAIQRVGTDAHRFAICEDLGYRASDLVQSNCIIWVEGPSDRAYIRHWINEISPDLKEHIHYSIMFYAGKLLSHLDAGDTDVVDASAASAIKLRELNRNLAVVIDSDRHLADAPLRAAKNRIIEEVSAAGGLAWLTAGREIENYIPRKDLVHAVDAVSPGRGAEVGNGHFDRAIPRVGVTSIDKVKVAHQIEKLPCDFSVLDLEERLTELVEFIRKANGFL